MRVNRVNGDSQTPSMGLRQGCPLIASLFSLFTDGLHHYLETAIPTAGIRILQMRLRELIYTDDICLMASSPEQLQALIDALAVYCATSRMEISEPKTKVMVVSAVPAPAVYFTCNGNTVEQVATYEYLGLHFHQSGSIVHLVIPIKARAGGSWAAVQRHHSLLQCGNTVNLHLHLLQAIMVPVLQCGRQIWDMHSPRFVVANSARAALQRLYDYYLRTICPFFAIHSSQAFADRGGPLAFASVLLWWRSTLQLWNGLAVLPVDSLYHTVCLDNLADAFHRGACNMSSSLAACLKVRLARRQDLKLSWEEPRKNKTVSEVVIAQVC